MIKLSYFIACKIGYFGPNCGKKCPYPKYGRKCVDGNCNCSENQCDFAVGCIKGKGKISETPLKCSNLVKRLIFNSRHAWYEQDSDKQSAFVIGEITVTKQIDHYANYCRANYGLGYDITRKNGRKYIREHFVRFE